MRQSDSNTDNSDSEKILTEIPIFKAQKRPKGNEKTKKLSKLGKKHENERKKNSLEEIAKKFIKYIRKSKTNKIDINDAVKYLNIKKRRIYDITNVLEGKRNNII